MKRSYHTIDKQGKANEKKLAEFLTKGGQLLLPMMDLIEQCQMACDELIDVAGRAAIQAVLGLSAQQVAGPRQQGKQRTGEVVWYGQQSGTVMLSDRKLAAKRPLAFADFVIDLGAAISPHNFLNEFSLTPGGLCRVVPTVIRISPDC